jgi:TonB-dependent SusC/RagA subfamily outer membrane receptor
MQKIRKPGRSISPMAYKVLLMTKLTFVLILATYMEVSAKVYAQESKITLSVENVSLNKALKLIESKSKYKFFYNNNLFPEDKRVTVKAQDVTVAAVLKQLLSNTSLTYKLLNDNLIVIAGVGKAVNPVTIKGRVTDEKEAPLPGVSVRLKGSTGGVSTGNDGDFQLTVPNENATLVFTFIGFKTQEINISQNQVVNVKLIPDQSSLNEVLVVGYGTQKRSDITGAVASFSAKNVEEKPINRVEQALIGQMPGVQVRQQTGMPGAGLSILVRGSGSITAGNEPLYVLDGFPLDVSSQSAGGGFSNNPLDDLNPNDIESIQVLKDASAAAIYGSRAANGVVIITTKRGQAGKVKINLNAKSGISQVAKKLDLLSPEEWVDMATTVANTTWVNSGSGRTADQTNAQRASILGLAAGTINTQLHDRPQVGRTRPSGFNLCRLAGRSISQSDLSKL